KLEQAVVVAGEQRADDVLHVPAGAEGAAGPGDDDGADPGLGIEGAEGVAQLGVHLEGEGVEPLGAVQRDRRDGSGGVMTIEEGPRGNRHQCAPTTAVASISTSARSSTSDVTSTSAIAG